MHFQVEVASHCEKLLNIEEKEHKRGKNRMRRKQRCGKNRRAEM